MKFLQKTTKTSGFESTFELLYDFCLIFFYSSTGLNSNKKKLWKWILTCLSFYDVPSSPHSFDLFGGDQSNAQDN